MRGISRAGSEISLARQPPSVGRSADSKTSRVALRAPSRLAGWHGAAFIRRVPPALLSLGLGLALAWRPVCELATARARHFGGGNGNHVLDRLIQSQASAAHPDHGGAHLVRRKLFTAQDPPHLFLCAE